MKEFDKKYQSAMKAKASERGLKRGCYFADESPSRCPFRSSHLFRRIPCERRVQLQRENTTMPLLEAILSSPLRLVVKVITYGMAVSKMLSPSLQTVRRKLLTCFHNLCWRPAGFNLAFTS